jgi:putative SOS response-associated peptidase YedK
VIIVGKSNAVVAKVHDRMPVILMPDDYDRWLDPNTRRAARDAQALRSEADGGLTPSVAPSTM